MKKILICLIVMCLFSFENTAQVSFSKKQLIGTWELDPNSLRECEGGFLKPIQKIGQSLITFVDSMNYNKYTWGAMSNGTYSIDPIQGDIIFEPVFDESSQALKPIRAKVAAITNEVLTFLAYDCEVLYEQPYYKVKSNAKR